MNATANFNIVYTISTISATTSLSILNFEVTVSATTECLLSSFISKSPQSSLEVIANGVNTLNFDTTSLLTISSDYATCGSESPVLTANITTLRNDHPNNLLTQGSLIQWRNASSSVILPTTTAEAHFMIQITATAGNEVVSLIIPDFEAKITPAASDKIINYPPVFLQAIEDIQITAIEGKSLGPLEFLTPQI